MEILMKIRLNGQDKEFKSSQNLNEIIQQFCRDAKHVIAEVNGDIVKSPQWQEIKIQGTRFIRSGSLRITFCYTLYIFSKLYKIEWSLFDFFVNAANVFAHDSKSY